VEAPATVVTILASFTCIRIAVLMECRTAAK
jgi:hypothetical protein